MANQEQSRHRSSCRCNACVARRNARRRLEEDRYRASGRPLPQRSQVYEIARDLPPVYEGKPAQSLSIAAEPRVIFDRSNSPRTVTTTDDIEQFLGDRLGPRPAPAPRTSTLGPLFPTSAPKSSPPVQRPAKRIATVVIAVLILTLIGIVAWWQWARIDQLIESASK